MAKVRVGINGFGRIGRGFVRSLMANRESFDLVLINDLTDAKTLGHLLRYDSVHGRFPGKVEARESSLVIEGDEVKIAAEKDPGEIPWKEVSADIVIVSSGLFVYRDSAGKHLPGGSRKVLISAPAKNADVTLPCGISLGTYEPAEYQIFSNASCTTDCL